MKCFLIYAICLLICKFHAQIVSANMTLGQQVLDSHGLNYADYFYWIAVGALIGLTVLFNMGFILALTFLKCKFNLQWSGFFFFDKYNVDAAILTEIHFCSFSSGKFPCYYFL